MSLFVDHFSDEKVTDERDIRFSSEGRVQCQN